MNGLTDIQSAGGNISEDPQAIYLVGGFLHLGQSSPCRNQGTAAGAPGWDFEGDPRPAEDAPDIGPDEYVP